MVLGPVPMTKVIEEQDVVCFSLQPQMSCPRGTYPINDDWRKASDEDSTPEIEFKCMSRNKKEARKMVKQLRNGSNVIEELSTMRSDRRFPVKQAKSCSHQQMMPVDYWESYVKCCSFS